MVLAGSAGGLRPIQHVLGGLDAGIAAAVLVALHQSPTNPPVLAGILDRGSGLPVTMVTSELVLEAGHVYVASPGDDLLVVDGTVHTHGPEKNHEHSSIDILLSSIALVGGRPSLAVLFSGRGHDGRVGAAKLHQAGGYVIVQDPATAEFSDLPGGIVALGVADAVLSLSEIPAAIERTLGNWVA